MNARVCFYNMTYNTHSFNVELATKVGLESALLLQHFFCWHEGNKDNPDMIKEDKVWFFTSRKSMLKVFPYLTDRVIRTRIENLTEGGYLVKGNFANNKLLRTNWYALTDKALSLFDSPSLVKKDAPLDEMTDDWSNRPMKKIYNKDNNINKETNILSYISKEKKGLDPTSEVATSHPKSAVVPLEERKQAFIDKVYSFSKVYDRRMLDSFIDYWTECGGRKMRFEKEKTYELALRLKTWKRNDDERQARYQPKYKPSVPTSNESKSDGYPQAVDANEFLKKYGI